MKKLENMSLEELLDFDSKYPYLNHREFTLKKKANLMNTISFSYSLYLTAFINNLLINHNIKDTLLTGLSITTTIISTKNIINNVQNKKPFTLTKDYSEYREKLPVRKELIRLYDTFLEDLVQEINKLPFDKDPLSIAILMGDYLIPSGIVSYTKKFHNLYTTNIVKQIINISTDYITKDQLFLEGLYILTGYGCCRHFNSFICDLFTKIGIINDKLVCIYCNFEELKRRKKECDFKYNHMVTGYLENNVYHIIDSYNSNYSLIKDEGFYYKSNSSYFIIPDFSNNLYNNQKQHYHYHINTEYKYFTEEEINNRRKKIEKLLLNDEVLLELYHFKKNHLELLEKIAYLVPLELERTKEKENQKLKRI